MVPVLNLRNSFPIAAESSHTRGGCKRVGRAEHGTSSLDRVKALPDHGNYWSGGHVLDEAGEERLALEVLVV